MRNRVVLGMLAASLFGLPPLAFSDLAGIDPWDVILDKAVGGMEEGSRVLAPREALHAGGGLVDAEATTSTDVVEQELTSSAGLEVDAGADTTTAPATSEVEGGVEADVEGTGAGDALECNDADGLPCPPKL